MHTYEIIFCAPSIDASQYPERTMHTKNSIIVDCTGRHIIPCGVDQVKLSIDGEFKTYYNVFSVSPYHYNEG